MMSRACDGRRLVTVLYHHGRFPPEQSAMSWGRPRAAPVRVRLKALVEIAAVEEMRAGREKLLINSGLLRVMSDRR